VVPRRLVEGSGSVFLVGDDRPLLNWIAYAFASDLDRDFLWVDVRTKGEIRSDLDVLARNLIPPERLMEVRAHELAPSRATVNVAVSGVIRDDDAPESVKLLLDFLRLPEHSQATLSSIAARGSPKVIVLSNTHRLLAFYPSEVAGPLVRAIRDIGITLIMTYADAPNEGRFVYDIVLRLLGREPENWRQARLLVEKGPPGGPVRSEGQYRLSELMPVAQVLADHLG
jgi:hypothetical protein